MFLFVIGLCGWLCNDLINSYFWMMFTKCRVLIKFLPLVFRTSNCKPVFCILRMVGRGLCVNT